MKGSQVSFSIIILLFSTFLINAQETKYEFQMPKKVIDDGTYYLEEIEILNPVVNSKYLNDFSYVFEISNSIVRVREGFYREIFSIGKFLTEDTFQVLTCRSGGCTVIKVKFYKNGLSLDFSEDSFGYVKNFRMQFVPQKSENIRIVDNSNITGYGINFGASHIYQDSNVTSKIIGLAEGADSGLTQESKGNIFKILKKTPYKVNGKSYSSMYYIEYKGINGWVDSDGVYIFKSIEEVFNFVNNWHNL